MDGDQIWLFGWLVEGAIGVLGGAIGTYLSIKNTAGPRERSFMVRTSVVGWIVISALVAGRLLLPQGYGWLLRALFGIGLLVAIIWVNRRQALIRSEENPLKKRPSVQADNT